MSLAIAPKSFLLAAALLAASSASRAEPVQVRPGLWATAVHTTVDGKPLGTPNLPGAADDESRRIQQAARQIGLPEGWQPSLSCQHESAVDALALIAKEEIASKCKFDVLEQRRDGGRFSMRCQMPEGTAQGSGQVTVVNRTESRFDSKSNIVMRGKAMTLETQAVSKWVGPDCQHPPAGIDPSWVEHD